MTATLSAGPTTESYGDSFPNSTKVYLEGSRGIRVPMREVALSDGEPALRVYDSSGPLGHDIREGLPSVRGAWIAERDVAERRNDGTAEGSPEEPASVDEAGPPSAVPPFRRSASMPFRRSATSLAAIHAPRSDGSPSRMSCPSGPLLS
jgi:hypothetical protein